MFNGEVDVRLYTDYRFEVVNATFDALTTVHYASLNCTTVANATALLRLAVNYQSCVAPLLIVDGGSTKEAVAVTGAVVVGGSFNVLNRVMTASTTITTTSMDSSVVLYRNVTDVDLAVEHPVAEVGDKASAVRVHAEGIVVV